MKKTETEKNRADTILVFILQHMNIEIIFYMCPPISPNSQLRKNNNVPLLHKKKNPTIFFWVKVQK